MLVPSETDNARHITLRQWRLALEEWLADLRLCKGHGLQHIDRSFQKGIDEGHIHKVLLRVRRQ